MKRLFEIFSKKQRDDHNGSQEKKENLEAKSNSNESSHESNTNRDDLFGDDRDLGYC